MSENADQGRQPSRAEVARQVLSDPVRCQDLLGRIFPDREIAAVENIRRVDIPSGQDWIHCLRMNVYASGKEQMVFYDLLLGLSDVSDMQDDHIAKLIRYCRDWMWLNDRPSHDGRTLIILFSTEELFDGKHCEYDFNGMTDLETGARLDTGTEYIMLTPKGKQSEIDPKLANVLNLFEHVVAKGDPLVDEFVHQNELLKQQIAAGTEKA